MLTITNEDNMQLMARYPDKYFDLCITDPPYGVNLKYNTYDDSLENWHELMIDFIPEIKRVCRMVIFPCCSINKLEWIYKNFPPDWLISWNKGSTGHSAYIGFNSWEPLLVYGKLKEVYFHDVLSVSNTEKMGNYGHPCPKPVKFYKHFLSKIPKGLKIIDPFLGSGTAAIACHDYGFDLTACELDKEYFDKAMQRINNHTSQTKLF